jgi:hypothetical protein
MEKHIVGKVNTFMESFKQDIKGLIEEKDIDFETKSSLVQFIYDYNNLSLEKEDFTKRKRIKSIVPFYLRCAAKRANGEQCTRKKRAELCYCGTHDKNRPHGIIDTDTITEDVLHKLEVWLHEINGIIYYIDKYNNVYKTEDIIANKINPNIIAKYKLEDGIYTIPEFAITNKKN